MKKIVISEGEKYPVYSFQNVTGEEEKWKDVKEISEEEFNEIERIMKEYMKLQDYLESWFYPDKSR